MWQARKASSSFANLDREQNHFNGCSMVPKKAGLEMDNFGGHANKLREILQVLRPVSECARPSARQYGCPGARRGRGFRRIGGCGGRVRCRWQWRSVKSWRAVIHWRHCNGPSASANCDRSSPLCEGSNQVIDGTGNIALPQCGPISRWITQKFCRWRAAPPTDTTAKAKAVLRRN